MRKILSFVAAMFVALAVNAQELPSTDFAAPGYSCAADAAVLSGTATELSGKFYLDETASPHHIAWSDLSKQYTAVATWRFHASRACYVTVTLDLGPVIASNKHIFDVELHAANGDRLDTIAEGPNYTGDGFTDANIQKTLEGQILIPAAGDYYIELRNNRDWCKGSIKNVILTYAADAPVIGAPAYYLVGSMNNWTPDSAYKFIVNPKNEAEYMLTKTLAVGDSMKVVEVVGNTTTWYPAGTDNDYVVDAAHAGEKTIYFQTTYKADWAEFGGYFWMEANPMPKATLDFATNTAWQFPTSKATAVASFSDGTYSITLQGTSGNGYRWYSEGYLLNGQLGATLTLPAFTWKTTKIVVTGRSAASGSTKMNVFVGDSAVSAETTGCKGVITYEIAADYQAPGNIYVLKVTSAHNAQFTKIEIYGEDEEPVAGCDWNELAYLADGSAEQTFANQFKLCAGNPAPENVATANIQTPGFATETGIYLTFPSAAFGEISLDTTKYDKQGAGILFHLSAFTAKVTDVSVVCGEQVFLFSVYNENGTTDPIIGAPEYYLVGSLNNWTPDSTYKFAKNSANENEYMLATTLAVGDSIKVLEIVGNTRTYYPDGMDNHYTVDAAHAGEKTIYFQTTYKADWAAFGGYMWIDANVDTIPTTAPAAPTAAEDDVLAIYCGKYNNNLHFTLAGWDGVAEDLDVQGTRVGYRRSMTWECVIDPAKTDSAHDLSGYKKLHADFWAPKAAKIKFTAEAVAGGNYKDGQVVNLAAGWNSFDFNVAEWPGNYDFKNVKCFVLEQYQNPEGASFEGNPFALANIYFYEKAPLELPAVSDSITWNFNKLVADTLSALYNKKQEAIQLADSTAPSKSDEIIYADYANTLWTVGEGFNAAALSFKGEYPVRKNKYCQNGMLHFNAAVAGNLIVKFSDTGTSASDSPVRRYLLVNGDSTEYWASRPKKNDESYESRLDVVTGAIPVPAGDVYITGTSALVIYYVTFVPQPVIGPEYYLAGNMNDWKAAEGYKFAANPAAEGEYMLTTTLALGNEFKVLGTGSIENTWYPDNAGNYVVTADYVGEKTIYFRPAGNPDWEGFHAGGYFYMEANPAPAGKITCDSVYNLAKGDTVALAPVTVTYANGKNLYVKDAMGAMLVYLGANGTWKAGDVLSNVEGVLDIYNGLYEVKTDTNQMKAITSVEGPVPAPEELDTIRLADVNKYIKIKDIQVAADTAIHSTGKATNINIIFDEDTIVLRNNFLLEYAFEAGKKYDITGVISYYVAKGASVGTLQVFPTAIEEQQIIGAPEYYLAGSMNGWAANADYKFAENPAKAGEYMLTTALALNDEFKVIGVVGATTTWYPTGMGNNYKVDADHAGAAKTIYFNPNGGQEGWYEGYFYVEPNVVPMENPIDTTKFFTGAAWAVDTLSTATWDAENQKVIVNLVQSKQAQWQGQLWLKLPMEVKAGKEYDLSFKAIANKTFAGTIVKYQESAEMVIDWDFALEANVARTFSAVNMPGVAGGNQVLVIDFGFAPAETNIEISEISIIEHEPTVTPAKFYVTGNDAFTVDAGLTTADSWNVKAFKSEADTMIFALKAGAEYQIKVSVDGTWNTAMGYNDLSEVTPGIIDADGPNHNIGFSLVEDGDVMVIYTAGVPNNIFKVVGNFVTQGLDDIDASVKAVKVLRNGQIFILRGDKMYTITGQPVCE